MIETAPTLEALGALCERIAERSLGTSRSVCCAESCTGGLVSHLLTEVPGSSGWFPGGIVAYADEVKRDLLHVPEDTLLHHGAVSAQVAVAMAEGARHLLRADVAVSVTGIAGPTGGTDAKPVGLTYVAVADAAGHEVRRYTWDGERAANKRSSAGAALSLLLERLGHG